uniref:Uncharacterized protein n=1 Tax=Marseillevirus LCMAC101 TaxID=2506602 RepID=A0A481YRL1_9VIRU|nr:MAG: hypothetical protein LCMAC101_02640 [Marseillevirus LCMAC101]
MDDSSYIKDLTEFFRKSLQNSDRVLEYFSYSKRKMKEFFDRTYIFNNGMIFINDKYALLACRLMTPKDRSLIHADMPIMWGSVYVPKDRRYSFSGWKTDYPNSAVFLCEITTHSPYLKFKLISLRLLTPNMIKGKEIFFAIEDIRLYQRKENYYLYYIGVHEPCGTDGLKGPGTKCVYMSEIPILLNSMKEYDGSPIYDFNFDIPNHEILCRNIVNETKEEGNSKKFFFWKNWSPWTYKNEDYLTDLYPDCVIYERNTDDQDCQLKNIDKNILKHFKQLQKYYTVMLSSGDTFKLFGYSATTPSIPVPNDFADEFLDGHRNLYLGIAHIRSQMGKFLTQQPDCAAERREMFEKIIEALETEKFYSSYLNFIKFYIKRRKKDKLLTHPDFYLMMLYFFNPKTGSIKYTSTAFLPVPVNPENPSDVYMRTPLVFPCGSVINNDSILISYGEGDSRARLMKLGRNVIKSMIIKYDSNYIKNFRFENILIPATNFVEKRTLTEIANNMFHPLFEDDKY